METGTVLTYPSSAPFCRTANAWLTASSRSRCTLRTRRAPDDVDQLPLELGLAAVVHLSRYRGTSRMQWVAQSLNVRFGEATRGPADLVVMT